MYTQLYTQRAYTMSPSRIDSIRDTLISIVFCCLPPSLGYATPDTMDEASDEEKETEPLVKSVKSKKWPESEVVRRGAFIPAKEAAIRDSLQQFRGGDTEIHCPAGRIDLMTTESMIEVKQIKMWKAALGQVVCYKVYYPNHRAELYLFGSEHDIDRLRPIIDPACHNLDVLVTYEILCEK